MWIILMTSTLYFFIGLVFICFIGYLKMRRFMRNRSRISDSTRIIRSISRVKFSEELFGAISDENECIICMMPFNEDDLITKLNCDGKHFYHTSCIEGWIKQGNNQCPVCRQIINADVEL